MSHAIQLPDILTRTRDSLTSRLAILMSKWQRMAVLMQDTLNLIAIFLRTFNPLPWTSVIERVET